MCAIVLCKVHKRLPSLPDSSDRIREEAQGDRKWGERASLFVTVLMQTMDPQYEALICTTLELGVHTSNSQESRKNRITVQLWTHTLNLRDCM